MKLLYFIALPANHPATTLALTAVLVTNRQLASLQFCADQVWSTRDILDFFYQPCAIYWALNRDMFNCWNMVEKMSPLSAKLKQKNCFSDQTCAADVTVAVVATQSV